jgi:magnesium-transporting ATPase (P-type)
LRDRASTILPQGHASVEDLIEEADGFAEVFPEHKYLIVKVRESCKSAVLRLGAPPADL